MGTEYLFAGHLHTYNWNKPETSVQILFYCLLPVPRAQSIYLENRIGWSHWLIFACFQATIIQYPVASKNNNFPLKIFRKISKIDRCFRPIRFSTAYQWINHLERACVCRYNEVCVHIIDGKIQKSMCKCWPIYFGHLAMLKANCRTTSESGRHRLYCQQNYVHKRRIWRVLASTPMRFCTLQAASRFFTLPSSGNRSNNAYVPSP